MTIRSLHRMPRALVALGAGAGLALSGAGCVATDPTEMVVLVDTDLPIASQDGGAILPGEIRSIRFQVDCIAEMGDPPCRLRGRDETTFMGLEQSYAEANLGTRPPFYFVLRRDAAGLRRTFRVTATAFVGPDLPDDSMEERVVSIASAATVEGEARVMVVGLRQECLNVECGAEQTCTLGGGCAPPATPANVWTGTCETVARPGFPSRACEDDLFTP
jgi:hypothetical protein